MREATMPPQNGVRRRPSPCKPKIDANTKLCARSTSSAFLLWKMVATAKISNGMAPNVYD